MVGSFPLSLPGYGFENEHAVETAKIQTRSRLALAPPDRWYFIANLCAESRARWSREGERKAVIECCRNFPLTSNKYEQRDEPTGAGVRAFSSEMGTGSRQENATSAGFLIRF
jgi:hypothetical protein